MGPKAGPLVNGWRIALAGVGTYGANYLRRATVAHVGLGANSTEDAVYPSAYTDSEGRALDSAARYRVHFARNQIPPVRAFWSLTVYDERHLFAENPINRYAIGDRDSLSYNSDGSLDIYVQREFPEPEKQSNWLPAPMSGTFTLTMRLYWPKYQVMDGSWTPPLVERVD
jgi:hypothetical protein